MIYYSFFQLNFNYKFLYYTMPRSKANAKLFNIMMKYIFSHVISIKRLLIKMKPKA